MGELIRLHHGVNAADIVAELNDGQERVCADDMGTLYCIERISPQGIHIRRVEPLTAA